MFWGKPISHAFCCISVTFHAFSCMSIVFLISLTVCYSLHVCYLLLASFQFSSTSHYCHMHETVFCKWSPIRQLTSHTYMLFYFLNLSFTICMHDHSLMLTLSISMHSLSHSLSVSRQWVWPTSAQALPSSPENFFPGVVPRPVLCNPKGQWLLAKKIVQCSHWAYSPY